MLGLETLAGLPKAGAMVVVVLAEAMVLYVGYGAIIGRFGDAVKDAVRGE